MPTTFLSSPQIIYVIPLPHNNVIGFNSKETLKSFLEECFLGNTQYDDLNQLKEYTNYQKEIFNRIDHIIETNQPKQGTADPTIAIKNYIDVKTLLKEFDDPVKWLQPQEPQSLKTSLVTPLESSVPKLILEMLNDLARFLTLGLLIQVKLLSSRSQTALITHSPSMQIQSRPVSQPVCPAIFSPNQTTNWIEPAMTMNNSAFSSQHLSYEPKEDGFGGPNTQLFYPAIFSPNQTTNWIEPAMTGNSSAFSEHKHLSDEPKEDGFGDPSPTSQFVYLLSTIGLVGGIYGWYTSQQDNQDELLIECDSGGIVDDEIITNWSEYYGEFEHDDFDEIELERLQKIYWRISHSSDDVLSILNTEHIPEGIKAEILNCFDDVDRSQGQLNFKKMIRKTEVRYCVNEINTKFRRKYRTVHNNTDQGFSHRSSLMRCEQSWSDEFKNIGIDKDQFDFKMNKMRANVSKYLKDNQSSNYVVTVGENRIQDAILMVLCLREQDVQFKVKTTFELEPTHSLNQFFNTDSNEDSTKIWLPEMYARHAFCDGQMIDDSDKNVEDKYLEIFRDGSHRNFDEDLEGTTFNVDLRGLTDFEKVEWLKYMSLFNENEQILRALNEIHTAALDNDTKSFSDFFKESLQYFSELEYTVEPVELEQQSLWTLGGVSL